MALDIGRTILVEFTDRDGWTNSRSVVSLHAYTHHSREVMSDLAAYIARLPIVGAIARRELNHYARRI
jgi:hypothetical protein